MPGIDLTMIQPSNATGFPAPYEDEFVVILAGQAVLWEDGGRTLMQAGDMAAFPKGEPNGHHLSNESDGDCEFLAFGRPPPGDAHYSDIDLRRAGRSYVHRDGSRY
ncbi:Cupin domain-containing protein [Sphingobium faniae]|nr:Cupin domain-containing protein [Sphingobium faniae]